MTATEAARDLHHALLRATLVLMRGSVRSAGTLDDLLARHPVLRETIDDAAEAGLADLTLDEAITRLDAHPLGATPLGRLRDVLDLDADGLSCFVLGALAAHDPRLAPLVDEWHGQGGRPTRATLARLFGALPAAAAVQALLGAAALREDAQGLAVPAELWHIACGLPPGSAAWRHTAWKDLPTLDRLVLPGALRSRIAQRAAVDGPACWVLRGTAGSGRRTLAGALAQAHGRGRVECRDAASAASAGIVATMLDAVPLLAFDPAPGERVSWAPPAGSPPVITIAMPRHGSLVVEGRACHRLDLDLPDDDERRAHWRLALGGAEPGDALAGLRLARGTLHRVARALPAGVPDPAAAMAELEELGRHALDGVARRMPPAAPGEPLALPDVTRDEFDTLVARCRERDRLARVLPAAFGHAAGVRALFKGASGTGKTLAARQLAAALQRPLYRVDLAATVSKYIGETERNLERVFEAAESLDIVLLLDEGDALLAGRTGVANATDRYANLETNYLLQRLEHYSGVLVVTTNAPERIDTAFARRMDVTLDFPLPDARTRLDLWLAHLAPGHAVSDVGLEQVALRCALAGGQIRNAALHATLLALQSGGPVDDHSLQQALQREYRKAGQQCPSLEEG